MKLVQFYKLFKALLERQQLLIYSILLNVAAISVNWIKNIWPIIKEPDYGNCEHKSIKTNKFSSI